MHSEALGGGWGSGAVTSRTPGRRGLGPRLGGPSRAYTETAPMRRPSRSFVFVGALTQQGRAAISGGWRAGTAGRTPWHSAQGR